MSPSDWKRHSRSPALDAFETLKRPLARAVFDPEGSVMEDETTTGSLGRDVARDEGELVDTIELDPEDTIAERAASRLLFVCLDVIIA